MRACVLLALVFSLSACGSDNSGNGNDLAMSTGDDLSSGGGGGGGGGGGSGGNLDGGYSMDAGGAGSTCMSACDCTPGLGCFNMHCVVTMNPVYCCGGMPCPMGSFCQNSGGGFGRCGMTGMPDLAGFDPCPNIPCNGNNGTARCMMAGCMSCVPDQQGNGNVCHK